MDTVTQALLGATVAHATCGRRLGRRALWWGAVGGALPDVDVVVLAPFGEFARLFHHRGITHSLWFGPLVGAALGTLMWRRRRHRPEAAAERWQDWVGLWVLALLTHPLLDLFTTYGTQLLAPFSRHGFAINGIGIIDPFYSLLLVGAVVVAIVGHRHVGRARAVSITALVLSTAYLSWGVHLNQQAERLAREQLRQEGVTTADVTAYPTVLQLWLRRIVVLDDDEVRVGYVSMLSPQPIQWFEEERQHHPLIDRLAETERGRHFIRFAQGRWTGHVRQVPGGSVVELDDLRYGLPPVADQGFWGIRAEYDHEGRLVGESERFRRSMRRPASEALRDLWRAASGYDPCTFRVGVGKAGPPPPTC